LLERNLASLQYEAAVGYSGAWGALANPFGPRRFTTWLLQVRTLCTIAGAQHLRQSETNCELPLTLPYTRAISRNHKAV
jgi:hypothetical protein